MLEQTQTRSLEQYISEKEDKHFDADRGLEKMIIEIGSELPKKDKHPIKLHRAK